MSGAGRVALRLLRVETPSTSPRQIADDDLLATIRQIHTDSRRSYGSPRVHGQLARRGVAVGRKTGRTVDAR